MTEATRRVVLTVGLVLMAGASVSRLLDEGLDESLMSWYPVAVLVFVAILTVKLIQDIRRDKPTR